MNHPVTEPTRRSRLLAAAAIPFCAILALASCSTVKVKTRPEAVGERGIASAEALRAGAEPRFPVVAAFAQAGIDQLQQGRILARKGAETDAAAQYLWAAVDAYELLSSADSPEMGTDEFNALLEVHNAALAGFADIWSNDPRRLEPAPYTLERDGEKIEIGMSADSTFSGRFFDRVIASAAVEERGVVRKVRAGIGAPLVGIREHRPGRDMEMRFHPRRGLHMPVTLTIDSVARDSGAGQRAAVRFSLRNPLTEQTTRAGSRNLPLAADYSAPLALLIEGRNELGWGLAGFLRAKDRLQTSGIYLLEPYDPDRIPVLLLHGLISVPIIWRDIIPELASEPDLSGRYQFMVFSYPSSITVAESAKLLRDQLAALRAQYDPQGRHPLTNDLVLAGHSMGGVLAHSLVTDFGDNLWHQFSDQPLDELPIDPDTRDRIRERVYFDSDPGVRRVVYFSAPHRGAHMAEKGFAGVAGRIARLPVTVLRSSQTILASLNPDQLKVKTASDGRATSIQSLRPGAPMLVAMDISPYRPGVVYHSIIGDRGRGDTPDSSDGVVEYWSAVQEGAASELIVPTNHGSYKHPDAIAELKRILREHLGDH